MRTITLLLALLGALALAGPARADCSHRDGGTPTAQDVVYASPDGVDLTLDVYAPAGPGPYPAALVLHGGSWRSGCKEAVWDEASRLAASGVVAFAIDYRLACSPGPAVCGYHAPAQADDARAALLWVRAHAADYGGDGTRVAAVGFSAGGNLAYVLGTSGDPGSTRADAVAGLSGPSDLPELCRANPHSFTCAARTQYVGCALDACPADWTAASPLAAVTPSAAPAFVAGSVNEAIVPFSEQEAFAAALSGAGVPNELCAVAGGRHARSIEPEPCQGGSTTAWDALVAFLLRTL